MRTTLGKWARPTNLRPAVNVLITREISNKTNFLLPPQVIKTPNGELDIRVQCPQGLILSTRLSTTQGGREFSKAGVPYDQFDFIHQMAENIMACYIRIPEPGQFLQRSSLKNHHKTVFEKSFVSLWGCYFLGNSRIAFL